jgi:hypothetical protein
MGIEIHITVPHNVADLSHGNVGDIFRPLDTVFGEISQYYSQRYKFEHPSRAWACRDTSFYQGSYPGSYKHVPVAFDAPAGFGFYFGPHVLSIHHHTRLGLFCTEPHVRQLLRTFTHRVLKLISGERAIYSPDDYGIFDLVFDGRTFSEIEAQLLRSGLPASSFAEFDARQPRPDYYYYIDRFEDFNETKSGAE